MYKYLFGPVPSRRLGLSLGLDLVPKKVCSLNCVYCEVGKTTELTLKRDEYISYDDILSEIKDFMANDPGIDYMTITGSGEPTLNSKIGQLIKFIKSTYPKVKIALLTNGTMFFDESLIQDILVVDLILPSLDAATQETFQKIDRPRKDFSIESYIKNLIDFRKRYQGIIWLEILFLKNYNDSSRDLALLKEAIIAINPNKVQLNTLDRPGVLKDLVPLTLQELESIVSLWGLKNVQIIASVAKSKKVIPTIKDLRSSIVETIARRPCTLDDLHQSLGINRDTIKSELDELKRKKKVKSQFLKRGEFFQLES